MTTTNTSFVAKTDGQAHLPKPSGKFPVGFVDIFTRKTEGKIPLLFRLYYPSESSDNEDKSSRYADAYARYKFSNLGFFLPVVGKLVQYITNWPKCPIEEGVKPSEGRHPLILFSHGLASCRTTYSYLCTDLASQGFYVAAFEHGDGSACLRMQVEEPGAKPSWLPQDLLEGVEEEYPIRNKQVHQRAREVSECLDLLTSLDKGEDTPAFIRPHIETNYDVELKDFSNKINIQQTFMSGHSFGGATTVLAMAKDKRFKGGVAFDSWLFPIKDEKNLGPLANLLFVNYERFQTNVNYARIKRFEERIDLPNLNSNDSLKSISNVITVKQASHYDCSDIPIILGDSSIGRKLVGHTQNNVLAYPIHIFNSKILQGWVERSFYDKFDEFSSTVDGYMDNLIMGISFEEDEEALAIK